MLEIKLVESTKPNSVPQKLPALSPPWGCHFIPKVLLPWLDTQKHQTSHQTSSAVTFCPCHWGFLLNTSAVVSGDACSGLSTPPRWPGPARAAGCPCPGSRLWLTLRVLSSAPSPTPCAVAKQAHYSGSGCADLWSPAKHQEKLIYFNTDSQGLPQHFTIQYIAEKGTTHACNSHMRTLTPVLCGRYSAL